MKKTTLLKAVLLAAGILSGGISHAQQAKKKPALEEAKKAIAASNAIYFEAFRKGDSSIFINRYAKDCWIMPPNAQASCGVDAPLQFYKMAYEKIGLRNGKFITI